MARQVADTEVMPGLRGRILDRNGATLAVTVQGDVIAADPQVINEPGYKGRWSRSRRRVCASIAGCAAPDRDRMSELLRTRTSKRYQRAVARSLARPTRSGCRRSTSAASMLERESRRFYPNRELAAHVVGHVDDKLRGLAGVEFSQDANIRGTRRQAPRVPRRAARRLRQRIEQPPTMGASVELTIDRQLQLIAERELAAGVKEYGAKGGPSSSSTPWTGEILAAASSPTFNPNAFTETTIGHQRNRAAQDIYEPGSTFKIVTASTGARHQIVTPGDAGERDGRRRSASGRASCATCTPTADALACAT